MDASDRIKTLPSLLQGGGRPHMATCYRLQEKRGFPAKPPAVAEHIVVVGDTHDPFIYMDTFLGLFSQELFVFNGLK